MVMVQLFSAIAYSSVPQSGATRDPGHGTKIMRGEDGTFTSSHLYL